MGVVGPVDVGAKAATGVLGFGCEGVCCVAVAWVTGIASVTGAADTEAGVPASSCAAGVLASLRGGGAAGSALAGLGAIDCVGAAVGAAGA